MVIPLTMFFLMDLNPLRERRIKVVNPADAHLIVPHCTSNSLMGAPRGERFDSHVVWRKGRVRRFLLPPFGVASTTPKKD